VRRWHIYADCILYIAIICAHSWQALYSSINSFLESLCANLKSDRQSATYIREVLHSALPHMNCESEIVKAF